jgi:hypothetical protein
MKVDLASQILGLHAAYCRLTGHVLGMNFARESAWFEWLRWRRPNPFSQNDLSCVVGHLREAIRKGDRRPAALAFRNLIGMPDYFEEDLALARQAARPRAAAAPRIVRTTTANGATTERRVPDPGTEDTSRPVSESALKLLREFKATLEKNIEKR